MRTRYIFIAVLGCLAFLQNIDAQTLGFTYQGQLQSAGAPASGNHDFEFALFDAAGGGIQLGSTITRSGVAVNDGIFTVTLDFGVQFPGANRFLEIRVRQAGGGAFTPLSPRQQVTSAPYAIRSLNAATADAVSVAGVPAGSGNYIQNGTSTQEASNFNISGTGMANIFSAATQYNIGTNRVLSNPGAGNLFAGVGAGRLNTSIGNSFFGANAGFSNTSGNANAFFGASAGFSNMTGTGNSFFGQNAGEDNIEGSSNSFFGRLAGEGNTVGGGNSFFGQGAGQVSTTGNSNSFFGADAGDSNMTGGSNTIIGRSADVGIENLTNATAIGARALVSQNNSLVLGSINGVNGAAANTRVGIGTSAPERTLHLLGPGSQELMIQSSDATGRQWTMQSSGDSGSGRFEIVDRTAVANRFTVLADGNVGIGTTAPTSLLTVGSPENTVVTGRVGVFSPAGLNLVIRETTNNVEGFFGANSGSGVFLGSATLDQLQFRTDNVPRMAISSVGLVSITNLGAAGASPTPLCRNSSNEISTCGSSSLRYKTRIAPFGFGLDLVKRLKPITFNWKDDGVADLGLGAEDVAAIEPLLVTYKDGQVEGVKYDRIGVVLVNAVKEQQAQIERQQRTIDALWALICKKNRKEDVCRQKVK